uniref:Secreted protein n=1 Tax=Anopheles merus TaxID=30066 RepID=A0A182VKX4_ANOME
MKNWLPFVFGPALAMLTVYGRSCLSVEQNSSLNSPPQIDWPPVPVPVGSPSNVTFMLANASDFSRSRSFAIRRPNSMFDSVCDSCWLSLYRAKLSSYTRSSFPLRKPNTRTCRSVDMVANFFPSGAKLSEVTIVLFFANSYRLVSSFDSKCTILAGNLKSCRGPYQYSSMPALSIETVTSNLVEAALDQPVRFHLIGTLAALPVERGGFDLLPQRIPILLHGRLYPAVGPFRLPAIPFLQLTLAQRFLLALLALARLSRLHFGDLHPLALVRDGRHLQPLLLLAPASFQLVLVELFPRIVDKLFQLAILQLALPDHVLGVLVELILLFLQQKVFRLACLPFLFELLGGGFV